MSKNGYIQVASLKEELTWKSTVLEQINIGYAHMYSFLLI